MSKYLLIGSVVIVSALLATVWYQNTVIAKKNQQIGAMQANIDKLADTLESQEQVLQAVRASAAAQAEAYQQLGSRLEETKGLVELERSRFDAWRKTLTERAAKNPRVASRAARIDIGRGMRNLSSDGQCVSKGVDPGC